MRLRDRGIVAFGSAVPQFGTYDLSARTRAGRLIADEYFLHAYTGSAQDRTDPDISPIYADFTGLPPVLIVVGADDILLQDNLALAVRLSVARVDVDLRIYPASPHGFTGHATPMAAAALGDIQGWLTQHLAIRAAATGQLVSLLATVRFTARLPSTTSPVVNIRLRLRRAVGGIERRQRNAAEEGVSRERDLEVGPPRGTTNGPSPS